MLGSGGPLDVLRLSTTMTYTPEKHDLPYHRLGGEDGVRRLAARFYDVMDEHEPALAKLHELDADGRVSPRARSRFAEFLVEWTGGPTVYSSVNGHPRLRMRHARVPVNVAMRDAWLRCMRAAMDAEGVADDVRAYLDLRFAEVADFMRNVP
jgi:hemoglobin